MKLKKALLVVDVQNDFCPGGALPVPGGDKVVAVLNQYIKIFAQKKLPIFASRDWHPKKTRHFSRYSGIPSTDKAYREKTGKKFGGLWPVHCVQGTKGAEFHPKLKLTKETVILSKGTNPEEDSYSAFQAEDNNRQPFLNLLKIFGVEELYVGGLATDYCVKFSSLDALKNGFKVRLLADAVKGVNLKPRDSEEAIEEMVKQGAKTITINKVIPRRLKNL